MSKIDDNQEDKLSEIVNFESKSHLASKNLTPEYKNPTIFNSSIRKR